MRLTAVYQFTVRNGGYAPDTIVLVIEPADLIDLIERSARALADASSSSQMAQLSIEGVLVKLKARPAKKARGGK